MTFQHLKFILSLSIIGLTVQAYGQPKIAAKEAGKHLNETVMICDKIYGGKYFSLNAQITLLDVGGSHPDEVLTLVIKGDDRKKFKFPPEESFKNKAVCITGKVVDYKGKPEIEITDPEQITTQ